MSIIVMNKETCEAVVELSNEEAIYRLNTAKYEVVTTDQYLFELNRKIKERDND